MSGRARQVVSDSAASYLRFAIAIAVQFALVPYMVARLGDDDYGLWTLTFSVLGFLSLVDFGFTTSVVRFTAESRGTGDRDRRNRLLSTVLVLYLALAVACALLLAGLTPFYGDLLGIPGDRLAVALPLLWVLAARSIAVSLPFGIFRSILFGDGRIGWVNLLQAGGSLLYGGASVAALATGGGLLGLAWANVGAFAVEHLAYLVVALRATPGLRLSPRLFDRTLLREAVGLSASQFVVTVSSLVLLRTDPLIVNAFLPLSAVALYGVALKVAENALMLVKQGVNVLGPHAAELAGAGRTDAVRRLLVTGSRFALAPAALMAAGALALGREGLVAWIDPTFGEAATVLSVLMVSVALLVPQMVASGVFTMTGHHRLTALAAVLSVGTNLLASVGLASFLGLEGVALGTLAATLLVDVGVVTALARRAFGIGLRVYALQVFGPSLVAGAVAAATMLGTKALLPPTNLAAVLAECGVGGVAFLAAFWAVGLSGDERAALRRWVARLPEP
jgi:O-antigen/teichoic acid export membrane protein